MAEHVVYPVIKSSISLHTAKVELEHLSDLLDLADDSGCPVFFQEEYRPSVYGESGDKKVICHRWTAIVGGMFLEHFVTKE